MKNGNDQVEIPEDIDAQKNFGVRILDLLASHGKKGMSLTEMQRALFTWSRPTEKFNAPYTSPYSGRVEKRPHRGWWCDQLLGDCHQYGLLRFYASKNAEGRWVRNRRKHNGHPWTTMSAPKSARMRELDRKKQHAIYAANAAKRVSKVDEFTAGIITFG